VVGLSENSTLFALGILLSGVAIAAFSGFVWFDQRQEVSTFESTDATVLSSEVDTSGDTTNIDITYEYTVDGETYRSSNIYPGVFDLNSNAESIVADNPEGATVTAYYDPENPSNAFLVKTKNTLLLLLLTVFGVLLTVVGVGQLRARFG
jgi:hypothetical protein